MVASVRKVLAPPYFYSLSATGKTSYFSRPGRFFSQDEFEIATALILLLNLTGDVENECMTRPGLRAGIVRRFANSLVRATGIFS
jgi:hypothetical protein